MLTGVEGMSLREAFGHALVAVGKRRKDFVVLDADVAGGTCAGLFRSEFPDRFIQCGIAEQNMFSVAAGLSTTGVIPIVTAYGVFASMRAIEQARNSIAYPEFNVKVAASHLGVDTGPDGPTHQCMEDMAIYRSIPNFTVLGPGDPAEMERAVEAMIDHDGPVYMRTGRSHVPSVMDTPERFEIGKGAVIREGKDATIIATGVMVHRAYAASVLLEGEGLEVRVVNMSTIKPIDADLIEKCARETGCIVTAEDHNVLGGLGGAVAEAVVKTRPVPVRMVGIEDRFCESGEPTELAVKYGLTHEAIAEKVREAVECKG